MAAQVKCSCRDKWRPQKSMTETLRKDCVQMRLSELNKNGEASGKAILEGCGGHQQMAGAVSKGLRGVCVCVRVYVQEGRLISHLSLCMAL